MHFGTSGYSLMGASGYSSTSQNGLCLVLRFYVCITGLTSMTLEPMTTFWKPVQAASSFLKFIAETQSLVRQNPKFTSLPVV